MDENKYTYPELIYNVGFTEAEKKRWTRNLNKLIQRVDGKKSKKRKSKSNGGNSER